MHPTIGFELATSRAVRLDEPMLCGTSGGTASRGRQARASRLLANEPAGNVDTAAPITQPAGRVVGPCEAATRT
jgi:hypothetical protein